MQQGRLRAAVVNADLDQDLLRCLLGILHKYIKVAILIKYPRIDEFVLKFVTAPTTTRLDKVSVRSDALNSCC